MNLQICFVYFLLIFLPEISLNGWLANQRRVCRLLFISSIAGRIEKEKNRKRTKQVIVKMKTKKIQPVFFAPWLSSPGLLPVSLIRHSLATGAVWSARQFMQPAWLCSTRNCNKNPSVRMLLLSHSTRAEACPRQSVGTTHMHSNTQTHAHTRGAHTGPADMIHALLALCESISSKNPP